MRIVVEGQILKGYRWKRWHTHSMVVDCSNRPLIFLWCWTVKGVMIIKPNNHNRPKCNEWVFIKAYLISHHLCDCDVPGAGPNSPPSPGCHHRQSLLVYVLSFSVAPQIQPHHIHNVLGLWTTHHTTDPVHFAVMMIESLAIFSSKNTIDIFWTGKDLCGLYTYKLVFIFLLLF